MPRLSVILTVVLVAVTGCKSEITSGAYGPISIGQSKLEALAALTAHGIWRIGSVLYHGRYINNPTHDDLVKNFSDEAGIQVRIGGYPHPLRIEFIDNLVSKTWPNYQSYTPLDPELIIKFREMKRLQKLIKSGFTRDAVFGGISKFETRFLQEVRNFVVGENQFREIPPANKVDANDLEYQKLVLFNDGWRFSGLKEEVWYEPILSPVESTVTVYFRNGRIERIEHWHLPVELP